MSDIVDRLRSAETAPLDADGKVALYIVLGDASAEIARLREERRWIPVGERLPPVQGEDVLVAQGPWDDGGYSLERGWWNGTQWMFYRGAWDMPPVAFWQPLPPPPGGEVEG